MFSLGLITFYEDICKCILELVGGSIVLGASTSCINVLFISEGTIFCSCWHKGDLQNWCTEKQTTYAHCHDRFITKCNKSNTSHQYNILVWTPCLMHKCVYLMVHITKLQLKTTLSKPLHMSHSACVHWDLGHWKSWCLHCLWPMT